MMRVGLDFGTHQTKICVQEIPDEGHGEPMYEFFKFEDNNGEEQYFLPSVVQLNDDDTLSYGYVDPKREKVHYDMPRYNSTSRDKQSILAEAKMLFEKYATPDSDPNEVNLLVKLINKRNEKLDKYLGDELVSDIDSYKKAMKDYYSKTCTFRYFKQATFAQREWNCSIDYKDLSIWYIAYVIFLLEKKYGQQFTINMGIPSNNEQYNSLQQLAVSIILTAYNLVEEVYQNDLDSFLSEKIEDLQKKTVYKFYTPHLKEDNGINIFPEAYATLISLTSRGKIAHGMNLTVDIGGGTTDVCFFTTTDDKPDLYRYWSIPKGLNYIAEMSGFDYSQRGLANFANPKIIGSYKNELVEVYKELLRDLVKEWRQKTDAPLHEMYHALKDRVIVYSGGGSSYSFLSGSVGDFNDIKVVDDSVWSEEYIKDKEKVSKLSIVLSTSYGLSIGESDSEVKICALSNLFYNVGTQSRKKEDKYVGKDQC